MDLSKRVMIHAIALILILSLSAGCKGSAGNPKSGDIREIDYHTGSQGLVLRFLPGSPPPNLYKGDPLSIVVEVSNKGAYDVNGAYLYISGYDPSYITFNTNVLSIKAQGKSEFNPLGDLSTPYEFYDDAVSMPAQVDTYSPRFLMTACYSYVTEAFKEVCIDPDPFTIAPREKVCIVSDIAFGTQGAPIAVTSVEEVSSRNRVQFKMHVSNVGGGTVFYTGSGGGSVADCHVRLKRTDVDKVWIKSAKFSDKYLKCEPEIIQLVNGQGISLCSYEGSLGTQAYLTVLNIQLLYGYRNSIQGGTDIFRIPGREY